MIIKNLVKSKRAVRKIACILLIIAMVVIVVDYLWRRLNEPIGMNYVTLYIGPKEERVDTKLRAKGTYYGGHDNPHRKLDVKWDREHQSNRFSIGRSHGAIAYFLTFSASDINKHLKTRVLDEDIVISYNIYRTDTGKRNNDIHVDVYILEEEEIMNYEIVVDYLNTGKQVKHEGEFPLGEWEEFYLDI